MFTDSSQINAHRRYPFLTQKKGSSRYKFERVYLRTQMLHTIMYNIHVYIKRLRVFMNSRDHSTTINVGFYPQGRMIRISILKIEMRSYH